MVGNGRCRPNEVTSIGDNASVAFYRCCAHSELVIAVTSLLTSIGTLTLYCTAVVQFERTRSLDIHFPLDQVCGCCYCAESSAHWHARFRCSWAGWFVDATGG